VSSRRVLLIIIAEFLVVIGLIFIPAGTVGWIAGWVFVALLCDVSQPVVRMPAGTIPKFCKS
jgi:hypothetical protein